MEWPDRAYSGFENNRGLEAMPTKPLDRLMFAQGGLCFFCAVSLPKAEASVEHLVPSSRAGANSDDNCVACCKAMNALLGSMSLKEKIKVVLNQKGQFKCPNGIGTHIHAPATPPKVAVALKLPAPKPVAATQSSGTTANPISLETISNVIDNLKSRGNARPKHLSSLRATLKATASFNLTDAQVDVLVRHLEASGKIAVKNESVAYKL